MAKIQTLRGFRDIIGEEINKFRAIEEVSRRYFSLFSFTEIEVPILEKTELFVRSIGDTTDIVEKEMFTFADLGGDSVTLRPEATAGVVRAYLQAGLYSKERISKIFTIGPMFRHEKPQKGRFREFHQIDVEVFGGDDPLVDAELLWMISLIVNELDIGEFTIEVNSVGCPQCRETFRTDIVAYFEAKKDQLCEDCLRRLYRNPLRIFDCKKAGCIETSQQSPFLFDSLCTSCKDHFEILQGYLNNFSVPAIINKRLVRGLDYYTKTVFEVTSNALGAQKAFIAGGRYDNLVAEMGGPHIPGSGFAIGIERLALLMKPKDVPCKPCYFFAYVGEKARHYIVPLFREFIRNDISLRYALEGKSLKSQMRYADSLNADFVLILGEDEIDRGIITLRDMRTKNQWELPLVPSELPCAALNLIA
ncbi:MAG: histidine--tRNA ligase [Syntrophus sp. (in: bacteria)]|nr:histidine--tRNA ligase [Syntrophus sp. (in: bacteria)]